MCKITDFVNTVKHVICISDSDRRETTHIFVINWKKQEEKHMHSSKIIILYILFPVLSQY